MRDVADVIVGTHLEISSDRLVDDGSEAEVQAFLRERQVERSRGYLDRLEAHRQGLLV